MTSSRPPSVGGSNGPPPPPPPSSAPPPAPSSSSSSLSQQQQVQLLQQYHPTGLSAAGSVGGGGRRSSSPHHHRSNTPTAHHHHQTHPPHPHPHPHHPFLHHHQQQQQQQQHMLQNQAVVFGSLSTTPQQQQQQRGGATTTSFLQATTPPPPPPPSHHHLHHPPPGTTPSSGVSAGSVIYINNQPQHYSTHPHPPPPPYTPSTLTTNPPPPSSSTTADLESMMRLNVLQPPPPPPPSSELGTKEWNIAMTAAAAAATTDTTTTSAAVSAALASTAAAAVGGEGGDEEGNISWLLPEPTPLPEPSLLPPPPPAPTSASHDWQWGSAAAAGVGGTGGGGEDLFNVVSSSTVATGRGNVPLHHHHHSTGISAGKKSKARVKRKRNRGSGAVADNNNNNNVTSSPTTPNVKNTVPKSQQQQQAPNSPSSSVIVVDIEKQPSTEEEEEEETLKTHKELVSKFVNSLPSSPSSPSRRKKTVSSVPPPQNVVVLDQQQQHARKKSTLTKEQIRQRSLLLCMRDKKMGVIASTAGTTAGGGAPTKMNTEKQQPPLQQSNAPSSPIKSSSPPKQLPPPPPPQYSKATTDQFPTSPTHKSKKPKPPPSPTSAEEESLALSDPLIQHLQSLPSTSYSPAQKLTLWVTHPSNLAKPYPTPAQKKALCVVTNMKIKSLEVWLTNYRQRKWKGRKERSTTTTSSPSSSGRSLGGGVVVPIVSKNATTHHGNVYPPTSKVVQPSSVVVSLPPPPIPLSSSSIPTPPTPPPLQPLSEQTTTTIPSSQIAAQAQFVASSSLLPPSKNWLTEIKKTLYQYQWPKEAKITFRALSTLSNLAKQQQQQQQEIEATKKREESGQKQKIMDDTEDGGGGRKKIINILSSWDNNSTQKEEEREETPFTAAAAPPPPNEDLENNTEKQKDGGSSRHVLQQIIQNNLLYGTKSTTKKKKRDGDHAKDFLIVAMIDSTPPGKKNADDNNFDDDDDNKTCKKDKILGVAAIKSNDCSIQHMLSIKLDSRLLSLHPEKEDQKLDSFSSSSELLHELEGEEEEEICKKISSSPLSSSSSSSSSLRVLPNVETWVTSLPMLLEYEKEQRNEQETKREKNDDSDSDDEIIGEMIRKKKKQQARMTKSEIKKEDFSKKNYSSNSTKQQSWEEIWKNVLVCVPLGSFVTHIDLSKQKDDGVSGSNSVTFGNDVQEESGEKEAEKSVLNSNRGDGSGSGSADCHDDHHHHSSITLEHAAILPTKSTSGLFRQTTAITQKSGHPKNDETTSPPPPPCLVGLLPLYFFRFGGSEVVIPKPDEVLDEIQRMKIKSTTAIVDGAGDDGTGVRIQQQQQQILEEKKDEKEKSSNEPVSSFNMKQSSTTTAAAVAMKTTSKLNTNDVNNKTTLVSPPPPPLAGGATTNDTLGTAAAARRTSSRIRLKQKQKDTKEGGDDDDDNNNNNKDGDNQNKGTLEKEEKKEEEELSIESESWSYLRKQIYSCLIKPSTTTPSEEENDVVPPSKKSRANEGKVAGKPGRPKKKVEKQQQPPPVLLSSAKEWDDKHAYTCAPLGQIWIQNATTDGTTDATTEKSEKPESEEEEEKSSKSSNHYKKEDSTSSSTKNSFSSSSSLSSKHKKAAKNDTKAQEEKKKKSKKKSHEWITSMDQPPPLDTDGSTLLGRRWVWDEGYYVDAGSSENYSEMILGGGKRKNGMVGTRNSLLRSSSSSSRLNFPLKRQNSTADSDGGKVLRRAYCNCGVNGGSTDDDSSSKGSGSVGRTRRSERSGTSVSMTNVLSELASGKLNPHTLIACEEYSHGAELRFIAHGRYTSSELTSSSSEKEKNTSKATDKEASADPATMAIERSIIDSAKFDKSQVQPFEIRVCPDASFLTDLHAHLSDSEIIGFLGGRYVPSERCIYIQAAFPCKSTKRSDSGFTDVEMDPVGQIMARDAILHHGMTVVGWYHSHPTFQPDPSVTDIENQGNYQRLFQNMKDARDAPSPPDGKEGSNSTAAASDDQDSVESGGAADTERAEKDRLDEEGTGADSVCNDGKPESNPLCPFVGLIIGTYDGRNPTAQSVMRWFHVAPKDIGSGKNTTSGSNRGGGDTNASSSGSSSTAAASNKDSNLSVRPVSARRAKKNTVHFPMSLQVTHREFRRFDLDKAHDRSIKQLRQKITLSGQKYRHEAHKQSLESMICPRCDKNDIVSKLGGSNKPLNRGNLLGLEDVMGANAVFCQEIQSDGNQESATKLKDQRAADMKTGQFQPKQMEGIEYDASNDFREVLIDQSKSTPGTPLNGSNSLLKNTLVAHPEEKSCTAVSSATDPSRNHHGKGHVEALSPEESDNKEDEEDGVVIQLLMPPDALSAFKHAHHLTLNSAESVTDGRETLPGDAFTDSVPFKSAPLTVSDICSSVTLSEPSVNPQVVAMRRLKAKLGVAANTQPACPLPFTNEELSVLSLGDNFGVNDDVRAGIIWFAVEREQHICPTKRRHPLLPKLPRPASSGDILELLLLPPMNAQFLSKENNTSDNDHNDFDRMIKSNGKPRYLLDDDAVLVHCIDVVLSHYSKDSHRVNPFESWSGAGEKGSIGKEASDGTKPDGSQDKKTLWWRKYYTEDILGMKLSSSGANGGSNKMKRGHKLCACLLRWAKHMQISCRFCPEYPTVEKGRGVSSQETSCDVEAFNESITSKNGFVNPLDVSLTSWDHDDIKSSFDSPRLRRGRYKHQLRKDMYFVAEVMRLVAARWREASNGNLFVKRTGKRGRPPKIFSGTISRPAETFLSSGGSSDARSSKKRKLN